MNKSTIYSIISFVSGAAISGLVCWKIAAKKERDIAEEEIKSIKEKFTVPRKERKNETEKKPEGKILSDKSTHKPSLVEYAKTLKDGGYINYSSTEEKEEKSDRYKRKKDDEDKEENKPYVIDPNDYGLDEEYEQSSLTLYADGILADEDDEVVNDVDEVVGKEALNSFGEYEDDAVHVCNPKLKVYFEILMDDRSYEEATKKKPPQSHSKED